MPRVVEQRSGWESFFAPTSADRIIGAEENKRSTKTYITSEDVALRLSLIASHAEDHARQVRDLDHDENCDPATCEGPDCSNYLDTKTLTQKYPGARGWLALHQHLVEHDASIEGFSLRVVARVNSLKEEQQAKAESSLEVKNGAT